MKLTDRVDRLEIAVEKHLEESGAIRADLRWLKQSIYGLGGLIVTVIVTIVTEIVIRR